MAPQMSGVGAATYSFSSAPKAVTATRKKYREPGETENAAVYRDLKETCITWDKRVHRGNTYSIHTQNAIKEALAEAAETASPQPRRKRKQKEPCPFAMPLPEKERIPVDLTAHLVAKEAKIEVETVEAQTDEFLPEPPAEQYQPPKTGVDVHTQVEDGELFNFDYEVEPILDVLVNKTLEQSIMEVEEEHEMQRMKVFKEEWSQRQKNMMADWQVQVEDEWRRWEAKEAIVQQRRQEKRREAQVLLKIQAMNTAKQHLARVVPNAVADLQEVAFPDEQGMAIDRIFLPQLLGQVKQEIHSNIQAQRLVDDAVTGVFRANQAAHASAFAAQKARNAELEQRRLEQLQLSRGLVRAIVDFGDGVTQTVGPFEISPTENAEQTNERVFAWLSQHEPALAAKWEHGVTLLLNGAPVEQPAAILESQVGQLSVVPKPAPPPPAEEGEGAEGEGTGEPGEGTE